MEKIMGFFGMFKKENAKNKADDIREKADHAKILNDYWIMCDSVEIMQETLYPETFFKRYKMSIEKAQMVINSDRQDLAKLASKQLAQIKKDKIQIFNDFFDRCDDAGKIPSIKDAVTAHRSEIPAESYRFFEELLDFSLDIEAEREYVLYSVVFSEGGRSYYYLGGSYDVHCGDYVTVPVGEYDDERTARVVKAELFKKSEVPFPINDLKYIIEVK